MIRELDAGRPFSASRISEFLWHLRYYFLLSPVAFLLVMWLHGALAVLAIFAGGGGILEWRVLPDLEQFALPGFMYAQGPTHDDWLVTLLPIGAWVALMSLTALLAPRVRRPALGRIWAILFFVVPAAAISGCLAFTWLGNASYLKATLGTCPIETALVATVGFAAMGAWGLRLFRALFGQALSTAEFVAGWITLLLIPWLSLGGNVLFKVIRAAASQ